MAKIDILVSGGLFLTWLRACAMISVQTHMDTQMQSWRKKIRKLGDIRYVLRRVKGDMLHVGLATGCEHEPRVRLEYNQEYGTE